MGNTGRLLAKLHYGVREFLVEAIGVLHLATKECKDISSALLVCSYFEVKGYLLTSCSYGKRKEKSSIWMFRRDMYARGVEDEYGEKPLLYIQLT